jgi:hypothetical protein
MDIILTTAILLHQVNAALTITVHRHRIIRRISAAATFIAANLVVVAAKRSHPSMQARREWLDSFRPLRFEGTPVTRSDMDTELFPHVVLLLWQL